MSDVASHEAMAEFILASGKTNFHTALLTYTAFPRAAEKLISNFAQRIGRTLAEEPGWNVTSNTLASSPRERWVELKWAPVEWEEFGWGVCLSPNRANAGDFIFGIVASTGTNQDAIYLSDPGKYPAMPDQDRDRLASAIEPLLATVGDRKKTSPWWPGYTSLRSVSNWMEPAILMKIASAIGIGDERDLVSGKSMDLFIVDMFRAAKLAIVDLPGLLDIRPT